MKGLTLMAAFTNIGIVLNEVKLSMEAQIEDQTQVPVFFDERLQETISRKIKLFRSTP